MKLEYKDCQLLIIPETMGEAVQIGRFIGDLPEHLKAYIGLNGACTHLWVGVDQLHAVDCQLDWPRESGIGRIELIEQLQQEAAELERLRVAKMAQPPVSIMRSAPIQSLDDLAGFPP